MKILFLIKKILNKLGWDIKKHRPIFESKIKNLTIKTILDIGANNGEYARKIRLTFPNAYIYSFEPLSDCYENLVKKMAEDNKFKAFNTALGNEKNEIEIYKSSFHPSSSILKMADLHKKLYPKSKTHKIENINVNKLDDILKPENLADDILIKIDVQGFEDKVIKGGETIIKRAKLVIIETSFVSLYEDQPLFNDIYQQMINLDFSYQGSLERHYDPDSGQLIYEDSIFINKK